MRRISWLVLLMLCLAVTRAQDDVDDTGAEQEESSPSPSPGPSKPAVKLNLDKATFKHLGVDGKELSSRQGKLGDKLFSSLRLEPQQTLQVTLTPQLSGSDKPQQAMLWLSAANGMSAYVLAKPKKGSSELTVSVTTGAIEKQLGRKGGLFTATLLLGDPSVASGVSWQLGAVDLGSGDDAKAGPKLLTARHQAKSNAKPAIAHMFRPSAKRPPHMVSLAFAGAALAPLGLAVVLLLRLGANLEGMPSGGSALWVLLFHGGLAAMLGLYLLFWTKLNLAQTLPLAAMLAMFLVASGYKALEATAALRIAGAGGKQPATTVLAKKTN